MTDRTPSRRAVLAATAPIAVDMALLPFVRPAQALAMPVNPDAPLFALRERWIRTLAAFNDALEAVGAAETARYAALDAMDFPPWLDGRHSAAEIAAVDERRVKAESALCPEIVKGLADAKAAEDRTSTENARMVEEIAATPARTLAGIAFKLKVSEDWLHGNEEMIDSIMVDVAAFAAAHPTLSI